ncbi:MAG: ferritin-like domain-containing protein [Hyphomicrobiales bacterium]
MDEDRLPFSSLAQTAQDVVRASYPEEKMRLAKLAGDAWRKRKLSRGTRASVRAMPEMPGRPEKPVLLAPREMPKRSASGERGRFALVHSLAHIELNAIDLTWDLLARFFDAPMPRSFLDDWVNVGLDEARHFGLLQRRLEKLGGNYGDLPAHHGLWEAAQETGHCLRARLAIVPLVLEARGLDVTPSMMVKAESAGDHETAQILSTIYHDEKRHVAFGAKWFRYVCEREGITPEPEFQHLVRKHFKGALKPPFNDKARSEAGLTPGFYKPLAALV